MFYLERKKQKKPGLLRRSGQWALFPTGLYYCQAGVPIFLEHWGNNLQFYPNFALFSTFGGMNLDHDFFQESKVSEDQKKKKKKKKGNTFFPEFR